MAARRGAAVLSAFIDGLSWEQTLARIVGWAVARESRYVCICNVHSVVTAERDETFRRAVNGADMATPDGMPVAWRLRQLGFPSQARINGPDLMWRYLAEAEWYGQAVYLYGSTEATLDKLGQAVTAGFPGLRIAGMRAPPFRELDEEEDAAEVAAINASGAGVVFVGLGCPKQELWMAAHRGRVRAVMIGVGAAFDYHAGTVTRAPRWMRESGLEWLHRLASEPRRLWRRYLATNTLFVLGIAAQMLGLRKVAPFPAEKGE